MANLTNQKPVTKPTPDDRAMDKAFLAWLRTLPSALDGFNERIVAAHYRRPGDGMGTKPLMSAIPLTWDQHTKQTHIGQFNFQPEEWWEKTVAKYLKMWQSLNS